MDLSADELTEARRVIARGLEEGVDVALLVLDEVLGPDG